MTQGKLFRYASLAVLLLGFIATARAESVVDPQSSGGLAVSPGFGTSHKLVALGGPGKFISAQITKQGGTSDLTFVSLEIDGRSVFNASIAALRNWSLTSQNTYGILVLQPPSGGNIKTVTIGFPPTLTYNKELLLSVTVNETGVAQIIGNVIHGK